MKKLLVNLAVVAVFAAPLAVASSAMAATAPNWNITGTWTFNDIYLGTPYVHSMTITSFDPVTGNFSGTGYYTGDPTLTWTINGTESGSVINFTLLTGGSTPGVTIVGTGNVDSATAMSGTGDQSNLPGPMPNISWTAAGTATPILSTKDQCMKNGWKTFMDSAGNSFKNQGDCVSFVATNGKNLGSL